MLKNNHTIVEYLKTLLQKEDEIIHAAEKRKKNIQHDIDALGGSASNINSSHRTYAGRDTFENWVDQQFEDGIPKRSKDLYPIFVAQKGKIDRKAFSSKLAIICAKKDGLIGKFKYPGEDKREQFIFGRKFWFEKNRIKPEFIQRIKKETPAFFLELGQ